MMRSWIIVGVAVVMGGLGCSNALAVDLRLDYRIYDNGGTEIDVVSRERGTVHIQRAVVNYSDKAVCNLTPVESDYGTGLRRSDLFTNPELTRFPDQRAQDHASLEFGEFVTAAVSRECGKVLAVEIITSEGSATFEF